MIEIRIPGSSIGGTIGTSEEKTEEEKERGEEGEKELTDPVYPSNQRGEGSDSRAGDTSGQPSDRTSRNPETVHPSVPSGDGLSDPSSARWLFAGEGTILRPSNCSSCPRVCSSDPGNRPPNAVVGKLPISVRWWWTSEMVYACVKRRAEEAVSPSEHTNIR